VARASGRLVASFHCESCTGAIDLIDADHKKIIQSVCPMCLGSVALQRRCAGSPWEVADWWKFCSCCGSYWRFEIPEPSRKAQVADQAISLADGARTINEKGERGMHVPERFERPEHDCWPGTP
jgi:hypothetical protein